MNRFKRALYIMVAAGAGISGVIMIATEWMPSESNIIITYLVAAVFVARALND